jgi:hypothetical protein
MNLIPDSIKLLGLVVSTKPFEYSDNVLTCNLETHIDIEDLKTLKKEIIAMKNNERDDILDDVRAEYESNIYFLDRIIEGLETK